MAPGDIAEYAAKIITLKDASDPSMLVCVICIDAFPNCIKQLRITELKTSFSEE